MLEISQKLKNELYNKTQNVKPIVNARFGDNRHLDNIVVTSGSDWFENQIYRKDPVLYWRFDDWINTGTSTADYSGNRNQYGYGYNRPPLSGTINGTILDQSSAIQRVQPSIDGAIYDSFDRGNTTNSLGYTSANPLIAWEQNYQTCAWAVNTNQASIARLKYPENAFAVINTFASDGIVYANLSGITNGQGLVCRFQDEKNFICMVVASAGTQLVLKQYVDGTPTTLSTLATTVSAGEQVSLSFYGPRITISDSINSQTHVLTSTQPYMHDNTRHGMMAEYHASYATMRWNDCYIQTYTEVDRCADINAAGSIYVTTTAETEPYINAEEFTVLFWSRKTGSTGTQVAASKDRNIDATAANCSFRIYTSGTTWYYETSNGTAFNTVNTGQTAQSAWEMVALVRKNGSFYFYIFKDGVGIYTHTSTVDYNSLAGLTTTFRVGGGYTNTSNYFDGYIDETVMFDRALSEFELLGLHKSGANTGTSESNGEHFIAECAIDLVPEETFAWAQFGSIDQYGKPLIANGTYRAIGEPGVGKGYGWWTRQPASATVLSANDTSYFEFDARIANKIGISSGFELGGINYLTIYYRLADTGDVVSLGLKQLTEDYTEFSLGGDKVIDAIVIEPGLVKNSGDFGRIYDVGVIYDVDISEDIMNFTIDKIREEYETTLPIGLTAANSGSITLNNTHQLYNRFNPNSDYASFIEPDTQLSFHIKYTFDDETTETIKLAQEMFVDSWDTDGSSMQLSANISDASKYLQERASPEGRVFQDVAAGKAVTDIARINGYPSRKTHYHDTFYNEVSRQKPVGYWRLSDLTTTFEDEFKTQDGTMVGSNYELGQDPLLLQEVQNIQYDETRNTISSLLPGNTDDINKQKVYSTRFTGTGTYVSIPDASNFAAGNPFNLTSNFSIQAVFAMDTGPTTGNDAVIVWKGGSDTQPTYAIRITESSGNYYIEGISYIGGALRTVQSGLYTAAELAVDKYVMFTKDSAGLALYVDGIHVDSLAVTGTAASTTTNLTIGRALYLGAIQRHFLGRIAHVAVWDRTLTHSDSEAAMSGAQILHLGYDAKIYAIPIFRYLYYKDETPWDAMLQFAMADVGMFYIDEDAILRYEYQDTFHEPVEQRYNTVQFQINDNDFIIDGSQPIEIQANKVVVKVNPKININNEYKQIWRADEGASLVVTTLSGNITNSQDTIPITDSEDPLWLPSGYAKIDDEIIQYEAKELNLLKKVSRGKFGTNRAAHSSGALIREVRVYDIEYNESPSVAVKYPFIIAKEFEEKVDIDKFIFTPFKASIIVSANSTNAEGDLILLEGTNPVTELNYYFSIAGIPLTEEKATEDVVEEVRTIDPFIRKYRVKEITIDNPFIQDKGYAAMIANHIIKFYGTPAAIINLETMGVPHLQLGDLIQVGNFIKLNISNKNYWLLENTIEYDGGVHQSLVMREYTEGI